MSVHINRPTATIKRKVRRCSTCKTRRRFILRLYEWYGSEWICCGCGHLWDEEGRRRAGKKRRAERREQARRLWAVERMVSSVEAIP